MRSTIAIYRRALSAILRDYRHYDRNEARYQFARSWRNTDAHLCPIVIRDLLADEFAIFSLSDEG